MANNRMTKTAKGKIVPRPEQPTFTDMVAKQRSKDIVKCDKSLVKSHIDVGQLKMRLSDISSQCFDLYMDTYKDVSDFAGVIQDMMGLVEKAQMILVRVQYGSKGGDIL